MNSRSGTDTGADPLSVIFVVVDRFKAVNDEHGHLVGDDALRSIARTIQHGIRPADLAARFGGDEFVILMVGLHAPEAAEVVRRPGRDVESTPFAAPSGIVPLTVSIGVAELEEGQGPEALLRAADLAMYEAKRNGRSRVIVRDYDFDTGRRASG